MKNPSYRIISLILLLTGVVFAQQHQGSNCLLVEVPLTTQVGLADIIIEGEVTYDTAAWNSSHTMILSRYLLKVHSVLKGSKVPSTLPVYIEGGVVGTEKVEVHPSPRMIEGEKGIFFLAKKATNPYTASATNKAYTLPAGPQSVMRYDLLRNEVHYPFGIHRGIKGFVGQVSRISGLYQNRGTSNFYKAANLQPRIQGQKNVLRFSPTTITAGTKSILTIQGTNFGTQTGRIHFRNANAGGGQVITLATDIVSWTNTQIEVYVPSGAGSGNFEVVTGSATFVSPGAITVPYNHLNPGTNRQDYMGRLVDYGGGKLSWQYSASIAANLPARASFERALETWRCQTFINWDISAQNTTATGQARDNINGVFFSQLPPGVLGVCWSYYNSCQIGGNPAYYTSELDIAFSPNFTWQYGPALPAANEFDFETVALHELGHGHQLGHIINNPAPMHASVAAGVSKRGLLAANEVAGGIWVMGRSTAAFGCNLNPMTALTTSNCPLSAPLASFSSNTTQTCPGGTVTFTDQSQRTTSWDWRFPGGTPATSTQQNPTVTYNTAGVYDVTLIAINAAGSDTSYQQAYITVAPPSATISGTANIITGNSAFIRFDLTGTAPWNVTYTDGTTNFPIVIPQSPHFVSVSPTITTAYTIVSVNDAGCAGSGQGSANITVGPPPPLRPGFGNPYWSFADQASSGIDVVKIGRGSNVQRWRIPYSGIVTDNISGFASDACGEPLFALVNIDRSRPNSSFCIDMQGNVLNSGNGFNAKNELAVQLIRVPETLNEWYVIYHRHSTNAYSLENVLYSRFRINCGNFTMLQKDIQLVDGSGSARLYTTHKAISPTTPVRPNTHWLYLCRRQQGSSATSLDRFLISKQGITWSANTGDIQVPWWGLTSAGSPIELSWQQDKIAVMYRNQDVNTTDLVIWDANQFSNAPAAHQRVSLGDLILQPDLAGIVTTAAAVDQIGQTNNSLLFLRNFERKMSRLEFSPSGQYLYIGAGGFVSGNFSNIDYLGQIDLNTPYPYAVRLQIQEPPFGTYNATTGQGCNRANNANCNNSFFANIGIRSGYDGKLYFFKFHSDSAYVIPQPDAPMPQMLTPGWVSLATATDTNIYMGAGGSISTIENIDGYRYPIENQTTPVIVSMRGCEGCLASAASPQDFEISTPGGTVLFCETIEQCPDTINVCVHPDSVYHLTWIQTGMFFNNAIVNGVAQQDSFVFVANTRPNVVLPQLPTICDTALQPISLSAIPQGGTFSGPGVVGNQFLPAVAGTGDHWIVYEIIDPNTRCKGIDSTKITIEFCCNLGAVSTLIQTVDLRCFGENIGSVSAVVSGATHVPLTYSLNGQAYQNSNQFSGLGAGIYTIYLRDTLNCDTSILFEIRSPDPFIIHDSLIGISCSGQNDASILVDTSGGTKPLSLFFNGSPSGGNTHFDNLSPGNYQIVVRDANGCSDTVDVQVPIRPPLSILFELIQDEICLGEEDGKIRIRGIGGTGSGYEFSLDGTNFQVADSFLNLSAGNYTIFLKDSNDCRTSETFTIDPGSQSIADFTVSTDECVLPTPVLLSNASQNAVQYDWNFGNGSSRQGFEPTFTYTDGGSYTITLITTDGNGCRDTAEQPIVIPRALVEVSLDSIGNISCFGRNDAFILVDTSGGVQPFTFQINGNPNGNDLRFANLSPGNYQIVAIDANGCSDTLDVEIPNIPSLDIVFELIEDEKCLGEMNGRVRFRGVGGSGRGYEFSLDGVNFQETDSFANLIPGNYTLFITDSDGCQINRPFTIEAGSQTTARFNVSAEPCILPMLISLRNESQNAVQYDWNLGDGEMRQGFEPAFTYADEDSYLITLITTNADGCRDTATQPITVSKAVTAAFGISPDITNPRFIEEAYFEFQNRSQNADFYRWDFGDNQFSEIESPVHRYNKTGDFCVKLEASSFAGCSDDTTICGINIFQSFVFFPSAFTPNGDGINETFDVVHSATFGSYKLDVYSRWGMQVFSTTSPDESWDGTYNGKPVPEGVYTYIFRGTIQHANNDIRRSGTITLIR